MKYTRNTIILFFLLLFNISIYSQFTSNQHLIKQYINIIDSINIIANNKLLSSDYDYKIDPVKEILQNTNLKKLKHIASLMFKATDKNYIYLTNYGYDQYLKFADSKIKGKNGLNLNGTAIRIQDQVKEEVSPLVSNLINVAYLLKVRVQKISDIIREENSLKLPAYIIDAIICDVFKGNGRFKMNDQVQFYYYKFWQVPDSFEVGKEYLVPLEPRGNFPMDDSSIIALVTYFDNSKGYYPIINNFINDKFNFFGFGEKIPFNNFEIKLNNKIKEIKSW